MFSIAEDVSLGVCRLPSGRSRGAESSVEPPGGGSRLGDLGRLMASRRDSDLRLQVAVLQELDMETQKGLEELPEEQRHLTQ